MWHGPIFNHILHAKTTTFIHVPSCVEPGCSEDGSVVDTLVASVIGGVGITELPPVVLVKVELVASFTGGIELTPGVPVRVEPLKRGESPVDSILEVGPTTCCDPPDAFVSTGEKMPTAPVVRD